MDHTISPVEVRPGVPGLRIDGFGVSCSCGWSATSTMQFSLPLDAMEHLVWASRRPLSRDGRLHAAGKAVSR